MCVHRELHVVAWWKNLMCIWPLNLCKTSDKSSKESFVRYVPELQIYLEGFVD